MQAVEPAAGLAVDRPEGSRRHPGPAPVRRLQDRDGRHPDAVRGLLLWRVTGGRFACERLAEEYYGQYISAGKRGGVAAGCELEDWKERNETRPANSERDLMTSSAPSV